MEKISLPPDFSGYTVKDSVSLLSQPLDGGLSRVRPDVLDASRVASVQWTTRRVKYEYLKGFYQDWLGRNCEPFLIDLYSSGDTLIEHTANFVAGSFKPIGSQDGLTFLVSAQLEILPTDSESTLWPSPSNVLTLAPDQSSYSVDYGNDAVSALNDGPASKVDRNTFNNAAIVSALWLCDGDEYAYLAACERASKAQGGAIFTVDLLLDETETLTTYRAQFVQGSFGLQSVEGETFRVAAQLEIRPLPYDVTAHPYVTDSGLSDRRLNAANAFFTLTAYDAVIHGPLRFNAASVGFNLTANDVDFIVGKLFPLDVGAFSMTAYDAVVTSDHVAGSGFEWDNAAFITWDDGTGIST